MSNNTNNTLIKNINRQRPALNQKIKNGESVLERNEKKLKIFKNLKYVIEDVIRLYKNSEKSVTFYKGELDIMHLEAERKRLITWISITEEKLELVRNKLRHAKLVKHALNHAFRNYDAKNKPTPANIRRLSNKMIKTIKNLEDLK